MNLVKWLRKNNTKVMAVVVIVLMFVFVGGSALERILMGSRANLDKVAGYFRDDRKITNNDVLLARQELEILRMLQADTILRGSTEPVFGRLDLRALLLGELLFSERTASPMMVANLRQLIRRNEYSITTKQINDIYRRSLPSEMYWFLLSKEAELAGVTVSNEEAGARLAGIYARNPDVFRGATYSRVIGAIVAGRGIPENQVLAAFGKLLAVMEYAGLVCSAEDLTTRQIRHNISFSGETIDVDFVRFDSSVFAEQQAEPNDPQIDQHFEKYKASFPGTVTSQNPCGFGYKFSDRVRLEYIALKLDDVAGTVQKPTEEEAEQYYQKNRDQFVERLPDPNDPNAPMIETTRSYAEVAGDIADLLLRQKTNSKADLIMQEARTLTEGVLDDTSRDTGTLSADQFRQMAGDYSAAADRLGEKYKVSLYAGQTGLLNGAQMRADEYLGRLYVRAYGSNMVRLPQIVFAVDEIAASEIGPFDVPKPRMYENIGPVRDIAEKIMAIVRVTQAEKASVPKSLNETISKASIKLGPALETSQDPNRTDQLPEANDVYTLREKVVEDLKKLAAMDTAKAKADEFKLLVANQGWDEAIDKFNKLYGRAEPNLPDANDVAPDEIADQAQKSFRLQQLKGLARIPEMGLETLAVMEAGSPDANFTVDAVRREAMLRDLLYSLVPPDSNSLDAVPYVLEFKPDLSCYCLKSLVIRRITQDQYEKAKVAQSYRADFVEAQSLYAVHFDPESIVKRMKFMSARQDGQSQDANAPKETGGAS
ncbi:MAG TPA: hypothetical protein VMX13_17355 [Sedimentisphaerales bacterium]|nr:hypothetical protein [Sedimentisphaerales bacterium]